MLKLVTENSAEPLFSHNDYGWFETSVFRFEERMPRHLMESIGNGLVDRA